MRPRQKTLDARTRCRSRDRVFAPRDAPARDAAIVLGCKPGALLTQRMDAACDLVHHGKVTRLLLTGLTGEMPAMQARALTCLPAHAVLIDDGASRTLENLRRARDRFGLCEVLVVTQAFHLARALYLADALGMVAVGVRAEGAPKGHVARLRERAARLRARVDVLLLRP